MTISPHYHLWTDALHARALAHQARDKWSRGTYVRWCVFTSWTVLEVACQDATGDKSVSYSFRKNLDAAIENLGLTRLDWGSGVWQRVTHLQKLRKDYVHRFVQQENLFLGADVADSAIVVVREGVVAIYEHTQSATPAWIQDDSDAGWGGSVARATMSATVTQAGVDREAPNTVRLVWVTEGREHDSEYLGPDEEWAPRVEQLIRNMRVPISEVRVYRGDQLIYSREVPMRGS